MEEVNNTTPKLHAKRKKMLWGLTGVFALAGLLCLAGWFLFFMDSESTGNAYVTGNIIRVYSRVPGQVKEILADNNQPVEAGQVLLRLDSTEATLALAQERAALAQTVRESARLILEAQRLSAIVELREIELQKMEENLERRLRNNRAQGISEEDLSHARSDVLLARLQLLTAIQARAATEAMLKDRPVSEQPAVLQAAGRLRESWLRLERCTITSPARGYVARRAVQPGARVTPDALLMAVVPLHEVWVEANFKESQLAGLRVGQQAEVTADIYGASVVYPAVVEGMSAGTGSSFSLLPPENATGNWVKIVQRVPVRLRIDAGKLQEFPLLLGLSCSASISTVPQKGLGKAILAAPAVSAFEAGSQEGPQKAPQEDTQNASMDAPQAEQKAPRQFAGTAGILRDQSAEVDFTTIDREILEIIRNNSSGL